MENKEGTGKTEGQQICFTDEQFIAFDKEVLAEWKEFYRKIELGQEVNKIVNKHGVNENGLGNDRKEALKTYKLYGKILI